MEKSTFNNLIDLDCPEGFQELSEVENQKYFSGDLLRLSFQDKEKHILLSLSKSHDSFFNKLINIKAVINGATSNLEKNLKEYQFIEGYESSILDKQSVTECFSYKTNDEGIKQYGEISVFKIKKAFYIIYALCRFENKDEYKDIFEDFKKSFQYHN